MISSFIRLSVVRLFVYSVVRLFGCSFIRLFVYSVIRIKYVQSVIDNIFAIKILIFLRKILILVDTFCNLHDDVCIVKLPPPLLKPICTLLSSYIQQA